MLRNFTQPTTHQHRPHHDRDPDPGWQRAGILISRKTGTSDALAPRHTPRRAGTHPDIVASLFSFATVSDAAPGAVRARPISSTGTLRLTNCLKLGDVYLPARCALFSMEATSGTHHAGAHKLEHNSHSVPPELFYLYFGIYPPLPSSVLPGSQDELSLPSRG